MKPKQFKEVNIVFAKDQPEYQDLPAFLANGPEGNVIICQRLTFMERLRVLITGEIWLSLLTFNKPLTPSFMTTKKSDLFADIKKK